MSNLTIKEVGFGFKLHSKQPISSLPPELMHRIVGEINWLKTHCTGNTTYLNGLFAREYAKLRSMIIEEAAKYDVSFTLESNRPIEHTHVDLKGHSHCRARRDHKELFRGTRKLDITAEYILSTFVVLKFRATYGLTYVFNHQTNHDTVFMYLVGNKLKDLQSTVAKNIVHPKYLLSYLRQTTKPADLNSKWNAKGHYLTLADDGDTITLEIASSRNTIKLIVNGGTISIKLDQLIYTYDMKPDSDIICELICAMRMIMSPTYIDHYTKA